MDDVEEMEDISWLVYVVDEEGEASGFLVRNGSCWRDFEFVSREGNG